MPLRLLFGSKENSLGSQCPAASGWELWGQWPPTLLPHLLSQEGLSGDAPLFSGQEEGGGQGGWLVPKPGNKSTPPTQPLHSVGLIDGDPGGLEGASSLPRTREKMP